MYNIIHNIITIKLELSGCYLNRLPFRNGAFDQPYLQT